MSGVIDENGVQWERCNGCGKHVRLDDLGYEKPSKKFPYGRDLCVECADTFIRDGSVLFKNIQPARSWRVVEYE
jgi:NAD-dependent SIR2 family protein deacetylase